ncbi:undecaprenyl diphosphate synthase [Angomonas deanei]|nr:undecaprenyl diphosphate synthase [Angomonas deanei]|eukprot:EPY35436.1 undecaprenyl diphosphate synthase [Angomonas deanei]
MENILIKEVSYKPEVVEYFLRDGFRSTSWLEEVCGAFGLVIAAIFGACIAASLLCLVYCLCAGRWESNTVIKTKPIRKTSSPVGAHGITHLAVIMDGNRRYGKRCGAAPLPSDTEKIAQVFQTLQLDTNVAASSVSQWMSQQYQQFLSLISHSALDGHRIGGEKLMAFISDCIELRIPMLTVYAFSTDNWKRPPHEVNVLMILFFFFFEQIRKLAKEKGIFIRFISTDPQQLPARVLSLMKQVECESRQIRPRRIVVNVCVSYSGQSEVRNACQAVVNKRIHDRTVEDTPVTTDEIKGQMLRSITQDAHEAEDATLFPSITDREPQVMLRTSGEQRISNFLLFESAYTEFFYLEKTWPTVTKGDLEDVIRQYSERDRRLGK